MDNKTQEYSKRNVSGQQDTKSNVQRKANNQGDGRDRNQNKNYGRSPSRYNNQDRYGSSRFSRKVKTEETVDDIKRDIERIEKEIRLEINEIKSLKL